MAIEKRGIGRTLTGTDFAAGRIEDLQASDFGPSWPRVNAGAAYRLQAFLRGIPFAWRITSSVRTQEQNKNAGGSKNSRHLDSDVGGSAFDLRIFDDEFFEPSRTMSYINRARSVGFNGVGIYDNALFNEKRGGLLHLDVRPRRASWAGILQDGKRKFTSVALGLRRFGTGKKGATSILAVLALVFLVVSLRR